MVIFLKYIEGFTAGETIHHLTSKTDFETDNILLSLLKMNRHPVLSNIDYSSKEQDGELLMLGILVFRLVIRNTVSDINM